MLRWQSSVRCAMRFWVALDDFGMGYAGLRQLQYMKSLPMNILKIDKMFVEGLPEDSSMIAAIIMLAQSLNF